MLIKQYFLFLKDCHAYKPSQMLDFFQMGIVLVSILWPESILFIFISFSGVTQACTSTALPEGTQTPCGLVKSIQLLDEETPVSKGVTKDV